VAIEAENSQIGTNAVAWVIVYMMKLNGLSFLTTHATGSVGQKKGLGSHM
jgi:hypothetical protein